MPVKQLLQTPNVENKICKQGKYKFLDQTFHMAFLLGGGRQLISAKYRNNEKN